MKFLVDHCAGRRLAEWLRANGHDVFDAGEESDPGDRTLLERAATEGRILVTLDRDFGRLVYVAGVVHAGLIRLPDVPVRDRLALMAEVLQEHGDALDRQALVTVRGGRIRVTGPHR